MSLASLTLTAQLKVFEQRFKNEVTTDHIKYDWDSGDSYSYIEHPVMREWDDLIRRVAGDDYDYWYDMFADFTNEWLYENDECPPNAMHVNADGTGGGAGFQCEELDVDECIERQRELLEAGKANDCSIWYLISAADDSVLIPEVQAELKINPRPVY